MGRFETLHGLHIARIPELSIGIGVIRAGLSRTLSGKFKISGGKIVILSRGRG